MVPSMLHARPQDDRSLSEDAHCLQVGPETTSLACSNPLFREDPRRLHPPEEAPPCLLPSFPLQDLCICCSLCPDTCSRSGWLRPLELRQLLGYLFCEELTPLHPGPRKSVANSWVQHLLPLHILPLIITLSVSCGEGLLGT